MKNFTKFMKIFIKFMKIYKKIYKIMFIKLFYDRHNFWCFDCQTTTLSLRKEKNTPRKILTLGKISYPGPLFVRLPLTCDPLSDNTYGKLEMLCHAHFVHCITFRLCYGRFATRPNGERDEEVYWNHVSVTESRTRNKFWINRNA
jgi:hypothetical protein